MSVIPTERGLRMAASLAELATLNAPALTTLICLLGQPTPGPRCHNATEAFQILGCILFSVCAIRRTPLVWR